MQSSSNPALWGHLRYVVASADGTVENAVLKHYSKRQDVRHIVPIESSVSTLEQLLRSRTSRTLSECKSVVHRTGSGYTEVVDYVFSSFP